MVLTPPLRGINRMLLHLDSGSLDLHHKRVVDTVFILSTFGSQLSPGPELLGETGETFVCLFVCLSEHRFQETGFIDAHKGDSSFLTQEQLFKVLPELKDRFLGPLSQFLIQAILGGIRQWGSLACSHPHVDCVATETCLENHCRPASS